MAEFCKQCNKEVFDIDVSDFKGQSTEADTKKGLYISVLCEGCGFILVDHMGECIDRNCPKHGRNKKE